MNQPPKWPSQETTSRLGKNGGFSGAYARWRRPQGVAEGTWDYVNDRGIADHYDAFVADTPLCRLDESILRNLLPGPKKALDDSANKPHLGGPESRSEVVFDFGCGSGRSTIPLASRGYDVVGIDLSHRMLEVLQGKLELKINMPDDRSCQNVSVSRRYVPAVESYSGEQPTKIGCVQLIHANLVQLQCIADNSADHGICLFSTLGMVQGRSNRREFLQHANRIIRPGGQLVVHVHHRWAAICEYRGWLALLQSRLRSLVNQKVEFGDAIYTYRGLEKMFMHRFSKREFRTELASAGWQIKNLWPISINGETIAPRLRIPGGYIAQLQSGK